LRQPEVGFPSAHEEVQPFCHRFQGSTRHARCQFANALLERLDCLVGNPSLDHPPWCFEESIAEEFAAEDGGNGALGLVHLKAKSAMETPQQSHHPLARPL
jgi:hypothetical protein